MEILQLLIVSNYSRRIIGFLRVNCIFIRHFWHWTRPNWPDPTCGWTWPVSNSETKRFKNWTYP